jgi:hypothetical protein
VTRKRERILTNKFAHLPLSNFTRYGGGVDSEGVCSAVSVLLFVLSVRGRKGACAEHC